MIVRRASVSLVSACALLVLSAPALAASQPKATSPRVTAQKPVVRAERKQAANVVSPQGFSVVLVLGDLQGAAGEDDVPPAARKALADMRDFLPYKSYKLLDAAWILCCAGSRVANRLRGPDDREYELEIATSPVENARVSVRFALRDAAAAVVTSTNAMTDARAREQEIEQLRVKARALETQLREARERNDADRVRALQAQTEELNAQVTAFQYKGRRVDVKPRADRSIIDTSFTMDVGETVVVGTSRLSGGSKALIALLTAVPPKSPHR